MSESSYAHADFCRRTFIAIVSLSVNKRLVYRSVVCLVSCQLAHVNYMSSTFVRLPSYNGKFPSVSFCLHSLLPFANSRSAVNLVNNSVYIDTLLLHNQISLRIVAVFVCNEKVDIYGIEVYL